MKLSIIMPIFNEKKTIKDILKKIESVKIKNIKKEIIIVNDCSTDGTGKILKDLKKYKILSNSKNEGKGYSIKKGIKNATGDIFLIQDGDLEYNPEEYPELIKPILEKKTKVVYGSRLKKKNKKGKFLFYLGGIVVTKITNILYNSKLTDEPTCYKVFHKELKDILVHAEANNFDWEPEVTAKILMKKYKIYEVPISYNPRQKDEGKKINFKDGLSAILTLIKWKFK